MPTETTAQRLIDATALKEAIKKHAPRFGQPDDVPYEVQLICDTLSGVCSEIDSAPTVETTDDVFARIPKTDGHDVCSISCSFNASNGIWKCGYEYTPKYAFGRTLVEAAKQLEEILNRK